VELRKVAAKDKIQLKVAQLDIKNDTSLEVAIDFIIEEKAS
jgi:hypothetical protein